MENKDLVIIALVGVTIYLAYQQNNQPNISDNHPAIEQLQQELQHYQTLYQKRVEKDLSGRTSFAEFQELQKQGQVYQQTLQEKAEISQELKGLKEQLAGQDLGEILTSSQQKDHTITQLETEIKEFKKTLPKTQTLSDNDQIILHQVQEFRALIETTESKSIDRNKINEIEKLTEQISQPSAKALANQIVTDSAYVLGHNSLLTKLADQEDRLAELRENNQAQLKQINLLFDPNSQNYETIDFNGLYSLLSSIAERERESKNKWWKRN